MMTEDNSTLAIRTNLPQMVAEWDTACEQIRVANRMLDEACGRLKAAFAYEYFDVRSGRHNYYTDAESVIGELHKKAWRALIEKMGIRKLLSIKRAEEIDKQLETGKDLPPITYANVLAMLETTHNQIGSFIEEAVKEVFDYLTPGHFNRAGEYETNKGVEIGDKVILRYAVERWANHWHVSHHRSKYLIALDNVFHALDGKGIAKGYGGPLMDAIQAQSLDGRGPGTGSTEYFEFKCFGNQNLHLKFRRPDLVAKLNQIAGGMRLKDVHHSKAA